MEDKPEGQGNETRQLLEKAINDPDIPHIYSNGFINAMGNGDILVLLQRNGRIEGTLNISFTIAKTLSLKLSQMIKDIEQKSGNVIMTTGDIDDVVSSQHK